MKKWFENKEKMSTGILVIDDKGNMFVAYHCTDNGILKDSTYMTIGNNKDFRPANIKANKKDFKQFKKPTIF